MLASNANVTEENAKQAYITMANIDTKKYKVVGLAEFQPSNGQPFTIKGVYGTLNQKSNEIGYLSIELADGSRFDLSGDLDRLCCESFGYTAGVPTTNVFTWDGVSSPSEANIYAADDASPQQATIFYVCEVSDQQTCEADSSVIVFTNNPLIPAIGYYNYHNGYYSHGVNWSFTGPDGQELMTDGTAI